MAQRCLLHLLTDIPCDAGTFCAAGQPVYVPNKDCPGALVNPGDDPTGMRFLLDVFIINVARDVK